MPRGKDITGQKFGRLTAVSQNGRDQSGKVIWNCTCECGNTKSVPGSILRAGLCKSCGCLKRILNLRGRKFGRLTVIDKIGSNKHKNPVWSCKCECGSLTKATSTSLVNGNVRSCGCLALDYIKALTTHGQSLYKNVTSEYNTWNRMKGRCNNPKNSAYKDYGGRGIKVCERWMNSFEAFFEDMGPKPGKGYSIERKNNNGNYEPGNCRWATITDQNKNKRTNRVIEHNGRRMILQDWANLLEITGEALSYRLKTKTFGEIYDQYMGSIQIRAAGTIK